MFPDQRLTGKLGSSIRPQTVPHRSSILIRPKFLKEKDQNVSRRQFLLVSPEKEEAGFHLPPPFLEQAPSFAKVHRSKFHDGARVRRNETISEAGMQAGHHHESGTAVGRDEVRIQGLRFGDGFWVLNPARAAEPQHWISALESQRRGIDVPHPLIRSPAIGCSREEGVGP